MHPDFPRALLLGAGLLMIPPLLSSPSSIRNAAERADGEMIDVVEWTLDRVPEPARPDSSGAEVTRVAPATACGRDLPCIDGWDLQALRVRLPAAVLPVGAAVPVEVEVRNRGRSRSPVAEVVLCFSRNDLPPDACDELTDPTPIPVLGGGETIRIRRQLRMPSQPLTAGAEARPVAVVSGDRSGTEANRTNNTVKGPSFTTERAALSWEILEVERHPGRTRPMMVRFRIRNRSSVARSESVDLQFEGPPAAPCGWGHQDARYRLQVPALAAGQALSGRIALRSVAARNCSAGTYVMTATLDPEAERFWGADHEAFRELRYVVE